MHVSKKALHYDTTSTESFVSNRTLYSKHLLEAFTGSFDDQTLLTDQRQLPVCSHKEPILQF